MPEDVLPSLLPMLIGGRFRFVLLIGSKLKRWSAQIQSYNFLEELTEDELPLNV